MRTALLTVACLACASVAHSQTLTAKLSWTTTDTQAAAQSSAYTLKVGTTVVPMGAVTCVAGTPTSCSAPLTTPLAPGNYTLTVSNAFGSATSDPLIGAGPGKPTITITVTVTAED